jgi:hypothetical protein
LVHKEIPDHRVLKEILALKVIQVHKVRLVPKEHKEIQERKVLLDRRET